MADDYSADIRTTGSLSVGFSAAGSIDSAYDGDWFRVQLVAGTTYQFALGGALAGAARDSDMPTLALIDQATPSYALSTDKVNLSGAYVMRYKPLTSGTYYVAVNGTTASGTYSVSATALASDDHADGANSTEQLALGAQASGVIEVVGDRDAFVVAVEAGKTYVLAASGVGGAAAALPVVGLYSNPGLYSPQAVFGASDAGTRSFTATATGNYYAVVHDVDLRYGTGSYVLSFSAAIDDVAANAAGAGALTVGGASVKGELEVRGDLDWYKVSLAAGQAVTFLLGDASSHLGMVIVDQLGTVLASATQTQAGGVALQWSPPRAGEYYVQVQSPYASTPNTSATGSYTLQALLLGVDDYSADSKTVGRLAGGASIAGQFGASYDSDWIKVTLAAGDGLDLALSSVSAFGASAVVNSLALVNASGVTVKSVSAGTGHDPMLSYVAAAAGDYYVVVAGSAAIGTSYVLSSLAQPADAIAANNSTSATLAPGQLLTSTIDAAVDRDWFKLTTTAYNYYTISLTGAAGGGGTLGASGDTPTLTVFDAAGVQQSVGYLSGDTVSLSLYSYAATTYYVQVGATGYGTGTYTLRASDDSHPMPDTRAPLFSSLSGATQVGATGANLVVYFNEAVLRGDGLITLRLASGAIVETFDVKTSTHVAISGSQLTLDPSADLLAGTSYVIELGAASVRDSAGNAYAAATTHALRTADAGLKLVGGAGNDVFRAGSGNDSFNGGAGTDTVIYADSAANYGITQGILGNTVRSYAGTLSVDSLVGIERVQFDNLAYAFDLDGTAGRVYRLYQAAFARTPDLAGVGFWIAQADKGLSTLAVAAAFAVSKEFVDLYGATLSDAQFVTQVYQNVLHRAPDAGGLTFWTDALAHGAARSDTLVAFSESAENQIATFVAMANGITYTPFLQ